MTRTSYRPLVAVALVAGLLAYVGCSSRTDNRAGDREKAAPTAGGGDAGSTPATATATAGSGPGGNGAIFADGAAPAAALLISGEQFGYLEPCGCTQGQLGGLKRRYDLVEQLRGKEKWPLTLLDLGSLIKDPAGARGGFEQAKLTYLVALKALGLLKYDALALSPEDLKVGTGEALMQLVNSGAPFKVLSANVVPDKAFEAVVRPSLRTRSGPLAIGVTAVLDPEALRRLPDPDREALLPTIKAPEEALPGVLADLEKDTQVQVLMVQGPPEMAQDLARKFPGFDVVVGTSPFDPAETAERLNDGKTLLVAVGPKGKYAAVVGLFPGPKRAVRSEYRRVSLDARYNGPARPMRDLIEDEFQEMLKAGKVVETFPRHDPVNGLPGAKFVGAESCRSCHPNTYAKWAKTGHARAFEDIVRDPKGERSDHQFDAECISCHTTGFEYNSGWMSAALTPALKGNQCENCHGPASKHVEDPDDAAALEAVAVTAAEADRGRLCLRCHDEDNSPKFDFKSYWDKIAHTALDSYDDPKVHRAKPVAKAPGPGPGGR